MNIKHLLLAMLLGAFILTACSTQTEEASVEESASAEVKEETSVSFSYDHVSTGVYWTAYKHSAKVAVKGIMDSIEVTGAESSESISELLENTRFSVYSTSVDSKDVLRDEKIRKFFFGNMVGGEEIQGQITSALGDNEAGDGSLNLQINDVLLEVPFTYEVEDDLLKLRCSLNFNEWDCGKSLEELHKACEEKHTGEDEKSIFWPNVDVLIETTFIRNTSAKTQQ